MNVKDAIKSVDVGKGYSFVIYAISILAILFCNHFVKIYPKMAPQLLILLLIISIFAAGYPVLVIKNRIEGKADILPNFATDLLEMVVASLKIVAAFICYGILFGLIFGLLTIAMLAVGAINAKLQAGLTLIVLYLIIAIAALIYGSAMMINFSKSGSFTDWFNFPKANKLISQRPSEYFSIVGLSFGVGVLYAILSALSQQLDKTLILAGVFSIINTFATLVIAVLLGDYGKSFDIIPEDEIVVETQPDADVDNIEDTNP